MLTALSICANQHADQDSVMFEQAGIREGVNKFADSKFGVIIFKMPADSFYEYSENGEKIAKGQGRYEFDGNLTLLDEALVGKSVFEEVLKDKSNIIEYSDRQIDKDLAGYLDDFDDDMSEDYSDRDDYGYQDDYDNGYGGGYGGYYDGDDFCY